MTELTVGDIRREIDGLPDDAPLFVTVPGGYDLPITWAVGHADIISPADAERGPDGRWPTRPGLVLHADPEWSEDERDSVKRSVTASLVGHVTQGNWTLAYRLREALGLIRLPDERAGGVESRVKWRVDGERQVKRFGDRDAATRFAVELWSTAATDVRLQSRRVGSWRDVEIDVVSEAARIQRESGVNPLAVGCAGDD